MPDDTMSPGPIGSLEDKAIDTVSKMAWFRNITFGQVVILIAIAGLFAGIYYMVPAHLKQIQSGYDTIDARHVQESREWRATIDKQWERVDEKDKTIRDFLLQNKVGQIRN